MTTSNILVEIGCLFDYREISKGVGRFRDLLQAVEVRGLHGLRQVSLVTCGGSERVTRTTTGETCYRRWK